MRADDPSRPTASSSAGWPATPMPPGPRADRQRRVNLPRARPISRPSGRARRASPRPDRRTLRRSVRRGGEQRRARRTRLGADQYDGHVQHALSQDHRRHRPARADHAARRLHEHQRRRDGVLVGNVEHAGRQPGEPDRRHSAHGRHGLATNNVSWARIDVTATTPPRQPERQRGRLGTCRRSRTPRARRASRTTTRPSSSASSPTRRPRSHSSMRVAMRSRHRSSQNGVPATVRVRVTSVR